MTFSRLISPDTRSGLIVAIGVAVLLTPIVAGFSMAAMASGLLIGVLAVGLGLSGTAAAGRGTLPVRAQATYDQGLAVGLLVSAAAFATVGDLAALAFFAAAGLAALAIAVTTRYSVRPAAPDFL